MTPGKDKHQFISKITELLSTFSNIQQDQFFYVSLIINFTIFFFYLIKISDQINILKYLYKRSFLTLV